MKLSEFDFTDLPKECIAMYPAEERDESKLMVIHRETETIEHKQFSNLIDYFDKDDLIVLNDTKVFPARLQGKKEKTSANIELFLLRELNKNQRLWDTLVEPARKIRIGNKLYFGDKDSPMVAEVIDNTTSRGRTIRFLFDGSDEEFIKYIKLLGITPLPKYIKRDVEPQDKERYQTIYAKHEGSVAAPTAGLHFSKHLLKRLEIKGVNIQELTLHVGIGTFNTIEVEDLSKHKMYNEQLLIDNKLCHEVNNAKQNKQRICAVGTTVIRGLESSISSNGFLNPYKGWTNKFIFPPYDFNIPNSVVTNFHMPKSTPLIMAATFAGKKLLKKAYKEAYNKNYRFYSYGDCMLIL